MMIHVIVGFFLMSSSVHDRYRDNNTKNINDKKIEYLFLKKIFNFLSPNSVLLFNVELTMWLSSLVL